MAQIISKESQDNYIFTDVVEVDGQETTILDITTLMISARWYQRKMLRLL